MSAPGCTECGHKKEGAVQPHHIGCANKRGAKPAEPAKELETLAPLCAKESCENEVPPSKGPRPAKFCPDHRTNRSKK